MLPHLRSCRTNGHGNPQTSQASHGRSRDALCNGRHHASRAPGQQLLLLSFLLSLSTSSFPRVSSSARDSLTTLLASGTPGASARLQILTQQTANNFSALPRVLPAHDDAKIQHVPGQISAAASLPAAIGLTVSMLLQFLRRSVCTCDTYFLDARWLLIAPKSA